MRQMKETNQMIRRIPAFRATILAAGIVMAMASFARAEEAAAPAPAAEFKPTIYVGPAFGYAEQDRSNFGWAMHTAMRIFEYGAIQIEYFNLDHNSGKNGDLDGVYFGLMPILPLGNGAALYGQVGAAISDAGDDVAGGGGVLYDLPIEFLRTNKIDLTARLDYKYLNIDGGDHLLVFGLMLGFHK